jgi:quinol monooxygenase YgiN
MVLVILRMKVIAEKRSELCQAIASLMGPLKAEKGCRRCDFCQSKEDENELHLLEEWDTRGNFNNHLKSDLFRIVRGAMTLLREPYEMSIHCVSGGNITTR